MVRNSCKLQNIKFPNFQTAKLTEFSMCKTKFRHFASNYGQITESKSTLIFLFIVDPANPPPGPPEERAVDENVISRVRA